MADCKCCIPPLSHTDYDTINIGVDKSSGAYADVSVEVCKLCGAKWLRYQFEYEHLTASGRWYRGIVPDTIAAAVTPESAISILEGLSWWLYGGSYFASTGSKKYAPLRVLI